MSPGLLLLLLVSSCVPVSSVPADDSDDEETNQGSDEGVWKKCVTRFKKNYRGDMETTINVLDGLGCAPLSAVLKIIMQRLPQEDALSPVKSGVKELQVRLDNLRAEMRWDAWAAGAYQVPVNNIEKAWDKYTHKNSKESLNKYYDQILDSTFLLHQYLTATPNSVIQNLGDVLAAKLKCHEKDVIAQFVYLNKLMYRGIMLSENYHQSKDTKARVDAANKMASQVASALFASHQRCISNSAPYIERDIFEHIDDSKKHQDIANDIRVFLEKTYNRYDWMVVAFSTENSKHIARWMKRHVLSGFTEVARGSVTVAAAKQVKGGDREAKKVRAAIDECLRKKSLVCSGITKKIKECKMYGKSLSRMITAIHTFKVKSQTSSSAVQVPADQRPDEESELTESTVSSKRHHQHTGKCGKVSGKFIIFIKSDEEITGVNACSKVKCRHKGKCVVVPRTFIALCKCQYPYYGDRCRKSLKTSWKPDRLRRGTSKRRSRTPGQKTRSKSLQPRGSARRGSRSKSPGGRGSRSKSPGRRGSRSKSPGRRGSRSKSPGRRGSRSKSPGRRGSRSKSPGRRGSRSKSPGRRGSRSKSPGRRGSRSKSPGRRGSRSKSPGRRGSMSRSPGRRGSRSKSPGRRGSQSAAWDRGKVAGNLWDQAGGAQESLG